MALRRIDPNAPASAPLRAWQSLLRTPVMRQFAMRVASRVDPLLLKGTGGQVSMGGPLPSALLTTKGAKSGASREAAVLYFHDGDDVILVASNFGRDHHPAWYHNLVAHPEAAQVNGEPYAATEVTGDEHERLFALMTQVYPGYLDYRRRAEAIGRRVPVLRLTPLR